MTELINGRTAEQIRFNISECSRSNCLSECPYEHRPIESCTEGLLSDALALIDRLEAQRDAAIEALKITRHCSVCKWHHTHGGICIGADECGKRKGLIKTHPEWEWAGLPEPPKEGE